MKKTRRSNSLVKVFAIFLALAFVATMFLPAFAAETVSSQRTEQKSKETLTIVKERDKVCMVTNMLFPVEQIPVKVGDKTYYGCCENCKTTLAMKPVSRMAKDPVSGKEVDKAIAVIGADAKGKIFYFENESNLKKFGN